MHKLLPKPFKTTVPSSFHNSYHLRSGQIVLVSDLLRVLASTFYTPGILDILLNILDRGDFGTHSQALWAVPPYLYTGKTFHEMYMDCLNSATTCFAIYRKPGVGKNIPFVWTLPPGDTVLQDDDMVYVMASKDWILENRQLERVHLATRKIQRAVKEWIKRRKQEAKGTRITKASSTPLEYHGYLVS